MRLTTPDPDKSVPSSPTASTRPLLTSAWSWAASTVIAANGKRPSGRTLVTPAARIVAARFW